MAQLQQPQPQIPITQAFNRMPNIPIAKLLNDAFVARYSRYRTLRAMLDDSGLDIEHPNDLAQMPVAAWDDFVRKNTDFASWRQMLSKAVARHANQRL